MIDSRANCYFSSTAIFNNKNIMVTDVFDLKKACPAILLDTELSTMDFIFKDLIGIRYALKTVVRTTLVPYFVYLSEKSCTGSYYL